MTVAQPEYASYLLRPRRSKTIHNFFATPKDLVAYCDLLRAELPGLSFIAEEYWEEFWEPKKYPAVRPPMPDPKGARPRTYASFADPATNVIRAWVEPKNWVPQWSEPFKNDGCRYLLNGVRSFVMLRRPKFTVRGRPTGSPWRFYDPPAPLHDDEIIELNGISKLWGAYDPADAAGEAFVRKAFRIATKFTRDDFIECERDTGRVVAREVRREHGYARCAPDAWRWLMARRHNYVATHHYWHKPSNYPFTERDFAHLPPPDAPPPAAPSPTPPAPSRIPRRRKK